MVTTGETDALWMQTMTWEDVAAYLDETDHPMVIVPIGSTEQHGPHLPLGVDAYEAIGVAEGIGSETGIPVTPPIWYGDANHHLAFPGTISLSTSTVVAVLEDVYGSLIHHGFMNLITVNGHRMANLPAISTAAKTTKENHPEAFLATIDIVRFGVDIHTELRDGDPDAGMHGGEFETSYMQYKHPDLVKEDKFEPSIPEPWTRFTSINYAAAEDTVLTASSWHDWREDDPGHQGDPTHASPEKGKQLHDALVENGVEFIGDVRVMREAQDANEGDGPGLSY